MLLQAACGFYDVQVLIEQIRSDVHHTLLQSCKTLPTSAVDSFLEEIDMSRQRICDAQK